MANKFSIPKTFNVAGSKWSVERVRKNGSRLGYCKHVSSCIEITETYDDVMVSESVMEQSFFHELTHAILVATGDRELNDDESFVERFSMLLHQAITTMEVE